MIGYKFDIKLRKVVHVSFYSRYVKRENCLVTNWNVKGQPPRFLAKITRFRDLEYHLTVTRAARDPRFRVVRSIHAPGYRLTKRQANGFRRKWRDTWKNR